MEVSEVEEVVELGSKTAGLRPDVRQMVGWITTGVRRALATPELKCRKDVWDLAVFGLTGGLDFTQISHLWLREAAKGWAAEDLPQHRGRQASAAARMMLISMGEFSESLRLGRVDHGHDPVVLGAPTSWRSPTGSPTSSAPVRSARTSA